MIIPVAERLGETKEYYFSTKLREIAQMNKEKPAVINLGIGNPDRPPHPHVVDALYETALAPDTHGYQSYKGAPELRSAFAEWYQRWYEVRLDPEKEILPLIGSKEGIMHLSMTFLNPGDEVLIPDPGYPTYQSASSLAGATTVPYNLSAENHWRPDFEEIEKRDLSRVKIMWVNYPQMPTGATADGNFYEGLIAFGKRNHILICHDNPYSFILLPEGEKPKSILQVPGAKEVAIELNSLSKSHNMAGWRIGALSGSEEVISQVMRFKSNMDSGMFLGLQRAAVKALSLGADWYEEVNEQYIKRKEKVKELLDLLDCKYEAHQQGLFVWAQVPNRFKDGYELSDFVLYGCRVFITPGGIFGKNGKKYVRVSLCQTVEVLDNAIGKVENLLKKEDREFKTTL